MKQQNPQFVVSYPKKSYRCYTIHWAIYEKEQLPDNNNKTSRGLEKVTAWPKGTRGFNNWLIKSLRFTTTVLHPLLLLAKPSAYGFTDEDIGLLRSYFSELTNRARIGTETSSEWKEMFRECLQGSNFWPPSLNVFQNDLLYNNGKSSIKMYADDHEKYVTRGKTTIKVLDKYAESGPEMKLLCVTFNKH